MKKTGLIPVLWSTRRSQEVKAKEVFSSHCPVHEKTVFFQPLMYKEYNRVLIISIQGKNRFVN